jgi:hemoglobin-like flavoprotein
MSTNPSERTRAIVAETLPLMEQHRVSLEEALERYMARRGPDDPSAAQPATTTRAIADMLIDHARELASNGPPPDLAATAQRHRALVIAGGHYSSFGDALKPVMKDVLGSQATPLVLAAWGATYWAIVRNLFAQGRLLSPAGEPSPVLYRIADEDLGLAQQHMRVDAVGSGFRGG